jgi:hypothetical protein
MNNTISVIIPTYNRAHMLPKTIASLLSQPRLPDEILVIDDGSTDNTHEIMQQFSAPVRYLPQAKNGGESVARNIGLDHAQGDMICFLDSDDTLPNDSIAVREAYLLANLNADAVYGLTHITDENHTPLGLWNPYGTFPSGDIFAELLCQDFITITSILLRRQAIGSARFPVGIKITPDYRWLLQIAQTAHIAHIPHLVAWYVQHKAMTVRQDNLNEVFRYALDTQAIFLSSSRFNALKPHEQAKVWAWRGLRLARYQDWRAMQRAFMMAWSLAPFMPMISLFYARAWRLYFLWGRHAKD